MTPTETVALCRYVRAFCPVQAIDDLTPDAWHEMLAEYPFDDCKAAVLTLARRMQFIPPSEIEAEVQRVRRKRIALVGDLTPPAELADDPAGQHAWLLDARRRIANGEITDAAQLDTYGELTRADVPEMRALLRSVDDA